MTDETTTETIWQFPCDFPIKVFGKASDEFELAVLTIIRKHVPSLMEGAVEMRPSKNGIYLAITITIQATSKAQLDALYSELSQHELVIAAY